MVDDSRPVPRSYVVLAAAALAVAYAQYELFYHTQNQYFFQGLAKEWRDGQGSDGGPPPNPAA